MQRGKSGFEKFYQAMGKRMRTLRERLGFSGVTVADAIGICPQTFYQWERGVVAIPAHAIWEMAFLFDLDIQEFFPESLEEVAGCPLEELTDG